MPVLGVCLGHQGLAHVSGGTVVHAPEVMHGRLSAIFHDESPLFAGIPQGFQAVRYHSLCVAQPLPACLEVTAWTADGVVMGRGASRPAALGRAVPSRVDLHQRRAPARPELPRSDRADPGRAARCRPRRSTVRASSILPGAESGPRNQAAVPNLKLEVRKLDRLCDPERVFCDLFADEQHAFWLDSSKAADARSRFSFMGAGGGPLSSIVTYDVADRGGPGRAAARDEVRRESIFDYLDRELRRLGTVGDDLPFDLTCGFVGYLGYELKADCDGRPAHRSSLPDAAFVFADRLVAFDHLEQSTYVVGLTDPADAAATERWVDETSRRVATPAAAARARHPRRRRGRLARRVPPEPVARDLHRGHRSDQGLPHRGRDATRSA